MSRKESDERYINCLGCPAYRVCNVRKFEQDFIFTKTYPEDDQSREESIRELPPTYSCPVKWMIDGSIHLSNLPNNMNPAFINNFTIPKGKGEQVRLDYCKIRSMIESVKSEIIKAAHGKADGKNYIFKSTKCGTGKTLGACIALNYICLEIGLRKFYELDVSPDNSPKPIGYYISWAGLMLEYQEAMELRDTELLSKVHSKIAFAKDAYLLVIDDLMPVSGVALVADRSKALLFDIVDERVSDPGKSMIITTNISIPKNSVAKREEQGSMYDFSNLSEIIDSISPNSPTRTTGRVLSRIVKDKYNGSTIVDFDTLLPFRQNLIEGNVNPNLKGSKQQKQKVGSKGNEAAFDSSTLLSSPSSTRVFIKGVTDNAKNEDPPDVQSTTGD